jgi:hypothetical protein
MTAISASMAREVASLHSRSSREPSSGIPAKRGPPRANVIGPRSLMPQRQTI